MNKKKIAWISNVILPDVSKYLGIESVKGGGWMVQSSELMSKENLNLIIYFPFNSRLDVNINGIRYISFLNIRNLKNSIKKEKISLVHVFGTEFKHSYEVIQLCSRLSIPTLLHVQGFVSELTNFLDYEIPVKVKYGFTLRDFFKIDNIFVKKYRYRFRGEYEKKAILLSKYISGRTEWDYSIVNGLKGDQEYTYFQNYEMLREEFYRAPKWKYENSEENQIFITQSNYPIKGLHTVIPEIKRLVNVFPRLKVFISGRPIYLNPNLEQKALETRYERYLREMIYQYELEKVIVFTGPLNPDDMVKYYLSSQLVLTPSLLENSPNSLMEALFLGVPSISTYTGGIPSMVECIEDYPMYSFHTPEIFFEKTKILFSNPKKLKKLSENSLLYSKKAYERNKIHKINMDIYHKILKDCE